MPYTVSISSAAYDDLKETWAYIAVNGGPDLATTVVGSIREALKSLATFPRLGKPCTPFEGIIKDVRRLSVGGYAIYYRFREQKIEVGRIVHQRRHRESILYQWLESR